MAGDLLHLIVGSMAERAYPVVTDVGALGDRVEDGVNGFKVPIGRPDVVLERLELLRSPNICGGNYADITTALWVTASDYAEKMRTLYHDIAPHRALGAAESYRSIAGQLHSCRIKSWRHQAPPTHIFDSPTQHDLMIELPETVTDWVGIQGAEYYIDDVCPAYCRVLDWKASSLRMNSTFAGGMSCGL